MLCYPREGLMLVRIELNNGFSIPIHFSIPSYFYKERHFPPHLARVNPLVYVFYDVHNANCS